MKPCTRQKGHIQRDDISWVRANDVTLSGYTISPHYARLDLPSNIEENSLFQGGSEEAEREAS